MRVTADKFVASTALLAASALASLAMPLSLSEIEDIRDECLADDLDIDFERMSLWSADEARVYFESAAK